MPKTRLPHNRRRPSANLLITIVVVLVAVGLIGAVLIFNNQSSGADRVDPDLLRRADSHTLMEAADDQVTVVEFLDYQCPACAAYYAGVTRQLEQDYDGRITFVVRNFPLDGHPLAVPAARAAEAAGLQGQYTQMYHALFDNFQTWAVGPDGQPLADPATANAVFDQLAEQIGLDMPQFRQDIGSPDVQQRIDQDLADGREAGVSGTPTLFVNGLRFEPSGETAGEVSQELREMIDSELAS